MSSKSGEKKIRMQNTVEEQMAHKDLRSFLTAIEASGDLIKIDDEVDWDQELCGIGRLSCERNGPAFLFNNIKDYAANWRILANPIAGWRRFAVGLGLPVDTPIRRLYEIYAEREQKLIPPIIVTDGSCKEEAIIGERIDLFDLPVPM